MAPESHELADLLAQAIAKIDPTIGRRLDTDPQAHLDLIVLTSRAHAETRALNLSAVSSARSAGWSWEAIGTALGMSKQAAQQRFGIKSDDARGLARAAPTGRPDRRQRDRTAQRVGRAGLALDRVRARASTTSRSRRRDGSTAAPSSEAVARATSTPRVGSASARCGSRGSTSSARSPDRSRPAGSRDGLRPVAGIAA